MYYTEGLEPLMTAAPDFAKVVIIGMVLVIAIIDLTLNLKKN